MNFIIIQTKLYGVEYSSKDTETVVIPNEVTEITDYSFSGSSCSNKIKKVIIPSSVTKIGRKAFFNCKNLEEVILPENITIDDTAFSDCKNLKSIKTA